MGTMQLQILFLLYLISGPVVADTGPCDRLAHLPPCAEACMYEVAHDDKYVNITHSVCTVEYEGITKCYENQCGLVEYVYGMNIISTVCDKPPRSRRSTQIGVGVAFIVLTTAVVGLRLVGRPPSSDSFGVDDAIGLITYCTAMVQTILTVRAAQNGWGVDMWALDSTDIVAQMKLFYICIIFFYFSVATAKLAILFFYLRIFTTQTFKRLTYAVILLCTTWGISVVIQNIFYCTPASFYWRRFDGVSQGTCLSYTAIKIIPPINIALDVVVMALPLPSILCLNLPLPQKIRVISMFSVGILIIIAGVLRLTHFYRSITPYNITYNGAELAYFGVIEADVSVICTCMPAIAVLLKRVKPQWFAASSDTRYPASYELVWPGQGTFRSSGVIRQPISRSEDNVHLITHLSDNFRLQKQQK